MKKLAFMLMAAACVTANPAYAEPAANPDTAAQDVARARQAEAEARRQMEISRIEAAGSQQRAAPDSRRIKAEQEARAAALEAERSRAAAERAQQDDAKRAAESRLKVSKHKASAKPARDSGADRHGVNSVSRIEAPAPAAEPAAPPPQTP